MMRGGNFHRHVVLDRAHRFRRNGWQAFPEWSARYGSGYTFVDLALFRDGYAIAVEVELSLRHVQQNVRRDLQAGFDEVHLLFPTAAMRNAGRRTVMRALAPPETNRVSFHLIRADGTRGYDHFSPFPARKTQGRKRENKPMGGDE